jgi:hypothetical protein
MGKLLSSFFSLFLPAPDPVAYLPGHQMNPEVTLSLASLSSASSSGKRVNSWPIPYLIL